MAYSSRASSSGNDGSLYVARRTWKRCRWSPSQPYRVWITRCSAARFAVAGISTVRQIGGFQRASETFSCTHWFTLSFSAPADATKSTMPAASGSADG